MYSRHVKKEGHKRDLDFEFISIRDNLKTKTKTKQKKQCLNKILKDKVYRDIPGFMVVLPLTHPN